MLAIVLRHSTLYDLIT